VASGTGAVTVTYSASHGWDRVFLGELTIVNHGHSPVASWHLVITLPGDRVTTVWNAQWRRVGPGSVIMTPLTAGQGIEPGASVSVNFLAQGPRTALANCTFDGFACP